MDWLRPITRLFCLRALTRQSEASPVFVDFPELGLLLISTDSLRRAKPVFPQTKAEFDILKKKRVAVQRRMTKEIDGLLLPLGYERRGNEWRRTSVYGRSFLGFQKSHYGFGCFFNTGTMGRLEVPSRTLAGTADGFQLHRIANFCPELPHNDVAGELNYVCLHDDPGFHAAVMTVLRARMIPWMEARHRASALVAMPKPEDMAKVKIFADAAGEAKSR